MIELKTNVEQFERCKLCFFEAELCTSPQDFIPYTYVKDGRALNCDT